MDIVGAELKLRKEGRSMRIKSKKVFEEGDYWRWEIIGIDDRQYLDGGNYHTEIQAKEGLYSALAASLPRNL
jgi:hypothetical protein